MPPLVLRMASEDASPGERPAIRPLVVDLVRAYEGILFGLVVIVLALLASGGVLGPAEFGALIVIPALTMVLSMRRGAPRDVFRLRATAALLGWAVAWILFPFLILLAYWAVDRVGGEYATFTVLAVLDGLVIGLVMTAADRLAARMRTRKDAHPS